LLREPRNILGDVDVTTVLKVLTSVNTSVGNALLKLDSVADWLSNVCFWLKITETHTTKVI